jgi:hypothetical protein
MPNQERTFEASGKTYTLRFTQNALYLLEKELGRPLLAALQSLGVVEVQAMMWAGLEGARLKGRAGKLLHGRGCRSGKTRAAVYDRRGWRDHRRAGRRGCRRIDHSGRMARGDADPKTRGGCGPQ